VVLYHFSEPLIGVVPILVQSTVSFGYLAVDLFFILSGYVIYTSAGAALSSVSWFSIKRFILSRWIRIYPLHFVILLLYLLNPFALWLFGSSGIPEGRYSPEYYIASIFLVHNLGIFEGLQWNIPSWSISVEFAAYLFCPVLIAFGISKIKSSLLFLVIGAASGFILLAFLFSVNGKSSLGDAIATMGLIRCLFEFWAGLCLGAICDRCRLPDGSWHRALRTMALMLLVAFAIGLFSAGVPDYYFVPIIFFLVIFLIVQGDALFSAVLSTSGIHYLGLISYSTYLIHYFVKDWVKFLSGGIGLTQFVIYIIFCFACSVVAYASIEKPSQKFLREKFL
jgi:peptidoglycan/LPS O-acetylase OafA/YrhL